MTNKFGLPYEPFRQEPLLPEIGVLALGNANWSTNWAVRHQILTRLSQYFHVVWVEPQAKWREILRGQRMLGPQHTDLPRISGFTVYTPEVWLPKLYRPRGLAKLCFDQHVKRANCRLRQLGCQKIILYIWWPKLAPALESIPFDLSCYHIDDEYSFSDNELPLDSAERRLIADVGQVFIHSPGLMEKKGSINPHTAYVPNGVDYRAYAKTADEPFDLKRIPHPRIGYSGNIKRTLDWPLLRHLIHQHSEWHFVFVGPPNSRHQEIIKTIQELSKRPNVHFLGFKPVGELVVYPQHFDVCIMPYRKKSHSTKFGYPLKLHEYLASGRPTVGTGFLRTLKEFAEVVALPKTFEEWSMSIHQGLSPAENTSERRTARQNVARRYDWQILVAQIAHTMAQHLGPQLTSRIEEVVQERNEEAVVQ